jgi:murein hydrolase activator
MENPSSELQDCRMAALQKGKVRRTFLRAMLPFCNSVIVVVLTVAVAVAAQPSDRARVETLARRASDRLQALQRQAEQLASQERSVLNDLRKLEVDRQIKAEELAQAGADYAAVQRELDATERRLAALEATEASERPELRARLVEMYKLGQARYARLLLSVPDLRRIGEASRTVAALAKLDRDRLAAHEKVVGELKATRTTLEERGRQAIALRTAAERAQAAAARAVQAQDELVRDIDRRRDLNAQLAGELQAAQQRIQAALRDASGADAALPIGPFRGDLDWPAAGDVRRRFGRVGVAGGGSSNGMEIATSDGAPVAAIHEGIVAFAGPFAGFGNLVIVDHGSQAFSLYGDLLEIAAAKGARVDRGQPIGAAGPLPSGGTGLYFELRIDGKPVDPLQWLKRR